MWVLLLVRMTDNSGHSTTPYVHTDQHFDLPYRAPVLLPHRTGRAARPALLLRGI